MNVNKCLVKPSSKVKLSKFSTCAEEKKNDKVILKGLLLKDVAEISDYQYKLYAEDRQSLLIIFQGMDASGKDGTIKDIMHGVNPQGIVVHSFKRPSSIELEHDFLWRHILKLPEHGQITIFNRSHYENVLIAKVHPEIILNERLPGIFNVSDIDKDFWERRYKQIVDFEKNLHHNGIRILKFFLHMSKAEQAKRLIERIENKKRHWKYSEGDLVERTHWNDYQKAYEEAIVATSTKKAPWYIIPADDKEYAHHLVGRIILEKLKEMDPVFSVVSKAEADKMGMVKKSLLKEI